MPGTAATVFEEGLAVPPIKFYDRGVRNDAVFTIIKRNTRVPETLAADLDSEVQACLMGARRMAELFERFGRETVEACFQAILDTCRDIFRNELLSKIADGEYRWEDYVEHDGVIGFAVAEVMTLLAIKSAVDDITGIGQRRGELTIQIGIVFNDEQAQAGLQR